MKIKALNGTYWSDNQKCFTVKQAASEYDTADDLPLVLSGENGEIIAWLEIFDHIGIDETSIDAYYYPDDSDDPIASVTI